MSPPADKIPRKGGPAITPRPPDHQQIDLAPLVGASLPVMERDRRQDARPAPFLFTNLKTGEGVDQVVDLVVEKGGL